MVGGHRHRIAFQFLKTTPRCDEGSNLRKADSTDRLDGGKAGRHDRFHYHRPVDGEVFMLTAPFIEPRYRTDDC